MTTAFRSLKKSLELYKRAKRTIPCQTQTLSKGTSQFVQGVCPIFLERGNGCRVWDVDGNEYIDCISALGPVVLGYSYPLVDEAIRNQLVRGISFSLPHPLEVELAEELTRMIPCAEMIRYGKNGSDVTSAAVRIARAFTGRDLIAICGYHGAQDWYIATTERSRGVPKKMQELVRTFKYNQIETLQRILEENRGAVAAVIMEPVSLTTPEKGFLQGVRELVHQHDALLIFDEIVTGFRIALGGAQEFYGVTPDLATFGKAMANGMPLSAVVGREEIMRECEDVFFSTTFGGETLSLAAGLATVRETARLNVPDRLRDNGTWLMAGTQQAIDSLNLSPYIRLNGYPAHQVLEFRTDSGEPDLIMKSVFQQEVVKRNVLTHAGCNLTLAHDAQSMSSILRAFEEALEVIASGLRKGNLEEILEGPSLQPVFRRAD